MTQEDENFFFNQGWCWLKGRLGVEMSRMDCVRSWGNISQTGQI